MPNILASLLTDHQLLLNVGFFLDEKSFALLEQTCYTDPDCLDYFWHRIAAKMFTISAIWQGGHKQTAIDKLQGRSSSCKAFARELHECRRAVVSPKAWRPWISKTSSSSLAINPFQQNLCLPCNSLLVSLPVVVGAFRGQSLVVGISIRPEGFLEDNVCCGIEALDPASARSMSIMFAPMSGNCFIVHNDDGPTIKTAALPALDFVPVMLRIWIHLTKGGGVQFMRQVQGYEPKNVGTGTGLFNMPDWIKEYFACLHIRSHSLQAGAKIAVDYSAATFPPTRTAVDSASDNSYVGELPYDAY